MLPANNRVTFSSQKDYANPGLAASIEALLAPALQSFSLSGSRVLLKPNLLTAKNGSLACTDARFLVEVARWCIERGAQVSVGDSPSFGSARGVLQAIGALPGLQHLGAEVVEFKKTRTVQLKNGTFVRLAQAALDCDLLLNLPKVKAHGQTRVTLAVKNCFGCVSGFQKPLWHMRFGGDKGIFTDLLVELPAHLPPALHLVDGIVAMHRTGPMHGSAYPLGCMVCGSNPVAVDSVLLYILRIDPKTSPLWLASQSAGLKGSELTDLEFDKEALQNLRVQGFRVPPILSPIRFNPFRFIKNSGKRMALHLFKR